MVRMENNKGGVLIILAFCFFGFLFVASSFNIFNKTTFLLQKTDANIALNDLNDTSIVIPSNEQILIYSGDTNRWENSSITINMVSNLEGGYSASIYQAMQSVDAGAAATTYTTVQLIDGGSSV